MTTPPAPPLPAPSPRQPALLHARLALPPCLAWNGERYAGARLQRIDSASALRQPGACQVFVRKHLVAVVAASDEAARAARSRLRLAWSAADDARLPRVQGRKALLRRGTAAGGAGQAAADYRWQGPAAPAADATLAVLATPTVLGLRIDLPFGSAPAIAQALAALLGMPAERIEVRSHRAARCAQESDDAASGAGIAGLLCRECMAPVSLLMEAGAEVARPTLIRLRARASGDTLACQEIDFDQPLPPPPLAWLLTGSSYANADTVSTAAAALAPPYDWCALDIGSTGASEAIAPAAATFAQEAFFDELAEQAGQDPVAYRLAHLRDPQGSKLIRSVTEAAAWQPKTRSTGAVGPVLRGRGFAYASSLDQERTEPLQTWSAWVADVEYDRASGELSVTRVVAGHDLRPGGAQTPPAAPTSPALLDEQARQAMAQLVAPAQGFDAWAPGAPARHLASVDLVGAGSLQVAGQQPGDVQLQAGGAFTLPAAAAVANAIYDATGVRLRSAPFSG